MQEQSIKDKIDKVLREIGHPEIKHTLFDLGMIKDVNVEEKKVILSLMVPMIEIPIKDYLINVIKEAIKKQSPGIEPEINLKEMNEKEKNRFMTMAREAWRG